MFMIDSYGIHSFFKKVLIFIFCAGLSCSLRATEILLFDSIITVAQDGILKVQETLTVKQTAEHKHGIFRAIPTDYFTKTGIRRVTVAVEEVTRDNKPVFYFFREWRRGTAVYIGDIDKTISPGIYTYKLLYTLDRQIGFFKNYDELYFNITGNEWDVPIRKVTSRIILPSSVPPVKLTAEAYTGRYGSRGREYILTIDKTRPEVLITTTGPLMPLEGLTIVVTWPKGFVTPPTFLQNIIYQIRDSLLLFSGALSLLFLALYSFFMWLRARRLQRIGTVIPLFEPPENISPGTMRFLLRKKYDSAVLTAELVELAVEGLLLFEYKKSWWSGVTYTIKKISDKKPRFDSGERIMEHLFADNDTIVLRYKYNKTAIATSRDLARWLTHDESYEYLFYNYRALAGGLIGALLCLIPFLKLLIIDRVPVSGFMGLIIALTLFLGFLLSSILTWAVYLYTPAGVKLIEKIKGFKMFLETTEAERLKIIGTPPTKTPELFERYLPYAIALGVERAWARQFEPLFEKYQRQGIHYAPIWYVGGDIRAFNPVNLSTSLSSSLTKTLIRSAVLPGTRSGAGGSGSSGGGGGGGGGGGW